MYDIIDGSVSKQAPVNFYTLIAFFKLMHDHANFKIKFVGTDLSVGELIPWRSSYDTPCITPSREVVTGYDVSMMLSANMGTYKTGYKGGQFYMNPESEFYVSPSSQSNEYKVCGFDLVGDTLFLNTLIDEY